MDVADDKESQVKSSCDQGCDCGTDQHVETVEEVLDSELVQVEINGIFQDLFGKSAGDPTTCSATGGGQDLGAKFVGLDGEQPIVQIGNQVFAGTWEHTLGTSLFFTLEDVAEATSSSSGAAAATLDRVFENSPADKATAFACKADKKLVLKRVFLTPKSSSAAKDTE